MHSALCLWAGESKKHRKGPPPGVALAKTQETRNYFWPSPAKHVVSLGFILESANVWSMLKLTPRIVGGQTHKKCWLYDTDQPAIILVMVTKLGQWVKP